MSQAPSPGERPLGEDLQAARVQFIQQTFPEAFASGAPGDISPASARSTNVILRWIHDRIFLQGWTIGAVRAELLRLRKNLRTIAVTSGKGGVGKTTFAVNFAAACALQGRRVLLFDADFGMANVHVFAGLSPKKTILDVIDGRTTLSEIAMSGPGGVKVICGASGVGRLADLDLKTLEALGRELLQLATNFDVLVIDTGAGVSASVMHFLGLAKDAVVVTTPNLAATLDGYGVIKVAHEAGLSTRMHVLVNQAADFSEASTVLGRIVGCAERFLRSSPGSLGFLERDAAFEKAAQLRLPLVFSHPANLNALRIAAIADQMAPAAPRPTPLPAEREPALSPPAKKSA